MTGSDACVCGCVCAYVLRDDRPRVRFLLCCYDKQRVRFLALCMPLLCGCVCAYVLRDDRPRVRFLLCCYDKQRVRFLLWLCVVGSCVLR